jgi:putative hemolysin
LIQTPLLRRHFIALSPEITAGLTGYDASLSQLAAESVKIPKLLRAYLTRGAKICGPPALDRQFKTIDFLTLLDLETMPSLVWQKFLGA